MSVHRFRCTTNLRKLQRSIPRGVAATIVGSGAQYVDINLDDDQALGDLQNFMGQQGFEFVSTTPASWQASATAPAALSGSGFASVGLSITPEAGTYAALVSTELTAITPAATQLLSIFAGGVEVAAARRTLSLLPLGPTSTQAPVTVDGTEAVEAQADAGGSPVTLEERSLLLVRIG